MFRIDNNAKIGKYLNGLIDRNYRSRRQFCATYLKATGMQVNDEELRKMNNRFTQIVKGKKGLQLYDLPIITELFGISCEELLSCGKSFVPVSSHVTNYDIAFSKDMKVWEKYMEREDKLFLNSDEYGKTVLDYAFEFKNYPFLQYLMDKKFIWLVNNEGWSHHGYGAGTSIKKREISEMDWSVPHQVQYEDKTRTNYVALAIEFKDKKRLEELKARETPYLHNANYVTLRTDTEKYYNERLIDAVAEADRDMLDYFSDEVVITDDKGQSNTFLFPYIGEVIDLMILNRRSDVELLIRKAIKHNKWVCEGLEELADKEFQISKENCMWELDETWINTFKTDAWRYFEISEQNQMVCLLCSKAGSLISNIVHATKKPTDPLIRELVNELNGYYEKILSKRGE